MILKVIHIGSIDLSILGLGVINYPYLIVSEETKNALLSEQPTLIGEDTVLTSNGELASNVFEPIIYTCNIANNIVQVYGYISGDNEITFFNDYDNELLIGNIEVTFPIDLNVYSQNNELLYNRKDLINKCTFGILYTDNYSQNRFVISGNELERNCDWWNDDINVFASSDDAGVNKNIKVDDLLYFPDENYCYYGTNKTAVIGYAVERTGRLVVFKEHSYDESTIFFRESVIDNETGQFVLNMFSGNIGTAPLSPFGVLNFNGDILFISNEKNVSGLDITNTIKDTTKQSSSRSYYIDNYLKEYSNEEFKNARLCAYKNYVLLLIGQDIFLGIRTSSNYEWFRFSSVLLENESFISLNNIEDNIYLGTSDGNIFSFTETNKDYNDEYKIFLEDSDFTDGSEDQLYGLVFNQDIYNKINLGDELEINSDCRVLVLQGNTMFILNDSLSEAEPGELIKYSPIAWLRNQNKILLVPEWGEEPYLSEANALLNLLTQREVYILNDDGTYTKVDFYKEEDPYIENDKYYVSYYIGTNERVPIWFKPTKEDRFIAYRKTDATNLVTFKFIQTYLTERYRFPCFTFVNQTNKASLIRKYPVNAFYITAPFNFNNNEQYKNLVSYTITNDTPLESDMKVSVISNNIPKKKAQVISVASNKLLNTRFTLSLSDYDFSNLSLSQDYVAVRGQTIFRNLVRQRFICFVFNNENDKNLVLSELSVVYTIGGNIVGGF